MLFDYTLLRSIYLEKRVLNSVMSSDLFLNPNCHETIALRSLISSFSSEQIVEENM